MKLAKEIASILPKLLELELSGSLVSDVGLKAIAGQCRRLVQLGLRSCAISRAAVEETKKVLPACVIDWDEPEPKDEKRALELWLWALKETTSEGLSEAES